MNEVVVTAHVGARRVDALLLEPDAGRQAQDPALLLTFSLDRDRSLRVEPYSIAASEFVAAGHRALSFDPPNHGTRVDQFGEGIAGMRDALLAGHDPFAAFVEDASAVIDRCIAEGIAPPGRIVVAGTSRSGYLAMRLLAADERIAAAVAYAPVTDWTHLSEFADCREHDSVTRASLRRYADQLVGRPLMLVISRSDDRVGSNRCRELFESIVEAERRAGLPSSQVTFVSTADAGHSVNALWHRVGAAFLLNRLDGA